MITHLSEAEKDREKLSISRLLQFFLQSPEAIGDFGIQYPAIWGLIGVDRKPFLPSWDAEDSQPGDIDVLVGNLELTIDEPKRSCIYREAESKFRSGAQTIISQMAWRLAVERGYVKWPPDLKSSVAFEVKASWYSLIQDCMKNTKRGRQKEMQDQVKGLLRMGFGHVAFLHFIATQPVLRPGRNLWLTAAEYGCEALAKLEPLFPPDANENYGYYASIHGVIPNNLESSAGAGPNITCFQKARKLPECDNDLVSKLHKELKGIFTSIPKPELFPVWIRFCKICQGWSPTCSLEDSCKNCGNQLK